MKLFELLNHDDVHAHALKCKTYRQFRDTIAANKVPAFPAKWLEFYEERNNGDALRRWWKCVKAFPALRWWEKTVHFPEAQKLSDWFPVVHMRTQENRKHTDRFIWLTPGVQIDKLQSTGEGRNRRSPYSAAPGPVKYMKDVDTSLFGGYSFKLIDWTEHNDGNPAYLLTCQASQIIGSRWLAVITELDFENIQILEK